MIDRKEDLGLIAYHGDGNAPFVENAAKWALQRIEDLEKQVKENPLGKPLAHATRKSDFRGQVLEQLLIYLNESPGQLPLSLYDRIVEGINY